MAKFITGFCGLLMMITAVQAQNTASSGFATVPASTKYKDPSFFKKLMLGKNYRKEWETPVKLPVFDLKKMGFTIKELGGGMQTKSLKLEDKAGREWALRTVDKDVEPNLPPSLRNTFAESIVQDMISAAHPYAPLTIPPMAKAIGLSVPEPTFYYIPDDPAFGEHQKLFAHTVCMLEEREPTPDNSETESTEDILDDLTKENDHLIIQQAVLKARLLDMLLADWDRHADQWRWGVVKKGDEKLYYAIPRDRDQAYFNSNGLLLKMVRTITLKHMVGYRDDLSSLRWLNFKSWGFDGVFLNELDKAQWQKTIAYVQTQLNDSLVTEAFKKMPPEIYPISGSLMTDKFKSRRDELMKAALKYYDYISTTVTVTGSEEKELFKVSGTDKNLKVTVYDYKDGREGRKLYERVFDPSDTKKIVLSGLGKEDHFVIEQGTKASIKIEMEGGEGADTYDIKGDIKNSILDDAADQDKILSRSRTKLKLS